MGIAIQNRENLSVRKRAVKNIPCRRTQHRFTTETECEYAFLNEHFQTLPAVTLPECEIPFGQDCTGDGIKWTLKEGIIIDAGKNIQDLMTDVAQYLTVNGKEFSFVPTDNPLDDLSRLFILADEAKPDGIELAIDYDEKRNRIVFLEYAECKFDYYTLFFLPVSFIEKVPENLRTLMEELCGYVSQYCYLETPENHFDLSFALGLWDNDFEERMEDEDYVEYAKFIDSYMNGDINALIHRCVQYPKNIVDTINQLNIEIENHKGTPLGNLLECFQKGIKLLESDDLADYIISPDHCSIDYFDDTNDDRLDLMRLFAMVYDIADPIVESATECLNGEAGILEIPSIYDWRLITQDITFPFKPSDYPKRWCQWFNDLTSAIEEI